MSGLGNPDRENLGSCCGCGRRDADGARVRNILMLHRRCPEPELGRGWGCLQCGLPPEGAIVVLCDECLEAKAPYKFAVSGYPKDNLRVPIESLSEEPFEHDMSQHPEAGEWQSQRLEGWDEDDWDDLDEDYGDDD